MKTWPTRGYFRPPVYSDVQMGVGLSVCLLLFRQRGEGWGKGGRFEGKEGEGFGGTHVASPFDSIGYGGESALAKIKNISPSRNRTHDLLNKLMISC